jgi:hypothetical protein
MIEEFKSDTLADFRQRYQGCYGWFEKSPEQRILVVLDSVDFALKFRDKTGMVFSANPDKGNKFSFLPVEKGVHWAGGRVVLCNRIPARQYRRGICADNTSIYQLTTTHTLHPSFDLLETIFGEDENQSIDEFRTAYKGNVVLDKMFSIVDNRVYLYAHLLGVYTPEKQAITLNQTIFFQEIYDTVTRNKLDLEITVK